MLNEWTSLVRTPEMSKLTKVTKLATDMCKIRDLLEDPEFSFDKMQFKMYLIEDWMNRVIRELDKAIQAGDGTRELDFTVEDLATIAQEARDLFNKYSAQCSYKNLLKNVPTLVSKCGSVEKWQRQYTMHLSCIAMLNGVYMSMSYAALMALYVTTRDYEESLEGQMLAGLKEALKHDEERI